MNCLTNEQMQMLVDGELPSHLAVKYKKHISGCPTCSRVFTKYASEVNVVKELIAATGSDPLEIPGFKVPGEKLKRRPEIRKIYFGLKIAAITLPIALIIGVLTETREKPFKPNPKDIVTYDICNTMDANTAFQEGIIITTIEDKDGNVIECMEN